jgi:hypothetical protein
MNKKSTAATAAMFSALTSLTLVAGLAQADTIPATAASTAQAPTVDTSKVLNNVSANYLNLFFGPSITTPLASTQPNTDTNEAEGGGSLLMKNYLSASYKLTSDMSLGPVVGWRVAPTYVAQNSIIDPIIKLGHSKLVNVGNFNLAADLRVAAPMSQTSRDASMWTYVMSKQISSYDIPNSRVSLSLTTYEKANFYSYIGQQTILEVYAGPQIDFKLLPNLSLFVLYEAAGKVTGGERLTAISTDFNDLEPGLSWDITPKMNFSPFLDLKTQQGIRLSTTQLGAVFSWKLL